MHTTNYYDTFISVAEDCPVDHAVIPPEKGEEKTIALLQFEMLVDKPYQYTSDEVLFHVFALRNKLNRTEWEEEKDKFFSKGQACFRASPLTKRYGWGVHNNAEGKMAIYPLESEEYKQFIADPKLKQTKGVRSKR